MNITFKVRKYKTKSAAGKYYYSYKYSANGHDWSQLEVEDCKTVKFIFSKTMSTEDIDIINNKWKHKLLY